MSLEKKVFIVTTTRLVKTIFMVEADDADAAQRMVEQGETMPEDESDVDSQDLTVLSVTEDT